jgi:hypothetical protein
MTGADQASEGGSSVADKKGLGSRKLKTRGERLLEESKRTGPESGALEVADEEFERLFYSYARQSNGVFTLNPMMFSTIWRLITGEKGNLFKEMSTFQK